MFIGFDDQKLKNNVWRFRFHLLFHFHQIPRALQNNIEFTFFSIAFIGVLCRAINRNNQAVKPTFNRFFSIFTIQKMPIRRGYGVNALVIGIFDHI